MKPLQKPVGNQLMMKKNCEESKPKGTGSRLMTLVLKIISGVLIAITLLSVVAWMTKGIWMSTIAADPSPMTLEEINKENKFYH